MTYNWQQTDWLSFHYDSEALDDLLVKFYSANGRVLGLSQGLNANMQTDTLINMMVSEAIKTSEIEGEYLSRQDVMSSIRNNLGLAEPTETVKDQRARGIGELIAKVRNTYMAPFSQDMLFEWHKALMTGETRLTVGAWRTHTEPMQVISGPIGKETIHFEAPPSDSLPERMARFIKWLNATASKDDEFLKHAPIRSGIAHLYFETLHPFEDGNGRIGRAISEKVLAQTLGHPVLISLSTAIEANKKGYYEALKTAQRTNNTTDWLIYFLETILKAYADAEKLIDFTLQTTKFFDAFKGKLNERQLRVIRRMLDEGPDGFAGGMSTKKYIAITHTSKPTATRDLQNLVKLGAFIVTGGGRSTRYNLSFLDNTKQLTSTC